MAISDKRVSRRALLTVPRSRGAVSGLVVLALGAWGAVIPFVGPSFDYAYGSKSSWTWTAARAWLEVLPGAVAVVGGLFLLISRNRITASFGAWLGVLAGIWFIVGRDCAPFFSIGSPGAPTGASNGTRLLESIGFFSGVGALMVFSAAGALGRLSVRSARDLHAAQRALETEERRAAEIRDAAAARDASRNAAQIPSAAEATAHEPSGSAPLGSAPLGSAPLGSAPLGSERAGETPLGTRVAGESHPSETNTSGQDPNRHSASSL